MPLLVTAVIKPYKLDEVRAALQEAGVSGLAVSEVQGRRSTETFGGAEHQVEYVPRAKVEVVVEPTDADRVIEIIASAADDVL